MSLPINLPAISIPEIPLPLEIPEVIHPAIVHFAIAIPVVIFLLEIYNLAAKRRTISAFSLFLLIVVASAMLGAYLTGSVDGKATWDMLSTDGQAALKAHKLLGIYLVYASLALVVLKLLVMAIRKTVGRLFFILILGLFMAVVFFQGKEGGELVYKYGANNEMVADMKSDGEDAKEELEETEEKLSELQTKYDELVASKSDTESAKEESVKEEEAPKSDEALTDDNSTKEDTLKEETPKVEDNSSNEKNETAVEEKKEEADSNETASSEETNSSN